MVTCDNCQSKAAHLECKTCPRERKRYYCSRKCCSEDWRNGHYLRCQRAMAEEGAQDEIGLPFFGRKNKKNSSNQSTNSSSNVKNDDTTTSNRESTQDLNDISSNPCLMILSKPLPKTSKVPGTLVETRRYGKNVRIFVVVYKLDDGPSKPDSVLSRTTPVDTCPRRKVIWARISQNFPFENDEERTKIKNRFLTSLNGIIPKEELQKLTPRMSDEESSIYPGRYDGDVDFFGDAPRQLKQSKGDIYKFKLAQLGRVISSNLSLLATEKYIIHVQVLPTMKVDGKFSKKLFEFKALIRAGDIALEGDSNFAVKGNDPSSICAISLKTTLQSQQPGSNTDAGTAKLELMFTSIYFPDSLSRVAEEITEPTLAE